MRNIKGIVLAAAAAMTAVTAGATEINLSKHISAVTISGDLRMRFENFSNDTNKDTAQGIAAGRGRTRLRYRLRLGADLPLHPTLKAKLRLASGTGEQVSTNQSFDNLSSQNAIWIDLAMLEYKPWDFVKVQGGRMTNPLWTLYSSDIIWDTDFSPMGFSAGAEQLVGPVSVFGNAMYLVADEDSGNAQGTDQSEVSAQIGAEIRLPLESRVRLGFAQHQWINERAGTFGQNTTNNGNRRSGGVLQNEFRVNELTGQLSFWLARIPVKVQGTFIENVDALDTLNTPKKGDKGHQVGAIVNPGKFELAYFQKDSEIDATVADVADSDFGNGGTGRKGSIMWLGYKVGEFSNVQVKYFDTELEDDDFILATGVTKHDLKRLQIDYQVKF